MKLMRAGCILPPEKTIDGFPLSKDIHCATETVHPQLCPWLASVDVVAEIALALELQVTDWVRQGRWLNRRLAATLGSDGVQFNGRGMDR
jgi:hypothetical protein